MHQVKKDFPDAAISEGQPIKFPDERLESILYELDSKEIRKVIHKRLTDLETENLPLYAAFTEERDQTDEEKEQPQGLMRLIRLYGSGIMLPPSNCILTESM